ncbi:MAG: MFS transporter [Candidatus Shapirobacteria bacterium]
MGVKQHDHYRRLWQLSRSLAKNLWPETEKLLLLQDLAIATGQDPYLKSLFDPRDPDLADKLTSHLEALLLANQSVVQSKEKGYYGKVAKLTDDFHEQVDNPDYFFRSRQEKSNGHPRDILSHPESVETSQILKKHGIIDRHGRLNLSDHEAVSRAEAEIGQQITIQRNLKTTKNILEQHFFARQVPGSLFYRQIFGNDQQAGLIDRLAEEVTKESVDEVKIRSLTNTYLQASSRFNNLDRDKQQKLLNSIVRATQDAVLWGRSIPNSVYKAEIASQETGALRLTKVRTNGIAAEPEETNDYEVLPAKPRGFRQKLAQELDEEGGSAATIAKFADDFSADPVDALYHYGLYSIINNLPEPVRKTFWKWKGKQKTWKIWYGVSTSGLAQKAYLEKLIWDKGVKGLGRTFGLITADNQWRPLAAMIWLGDRAVTRTGDLIGRGFDRIGAGDLGSIFHRKLGKKRKKEESLGASVLGLIGNLGTGSIKLVLQGVWALAKKIPFVKNLQAGLINNWVEFEARHNWMQTLRLAKGMGGALVRGVFSLNTASGAWLGFRLTGSPWGALAGAFPSATYTSWLNMVANKGLMNLLRLPQTFLAIETNAQYYAFYQNNYPGLAKDFARSFEGNTATRFLRGLGKPAVWLEVNSWARLPLRGAAIGNLLQMAGVPAYLAYPIPMIGEYLWLAKGFWLPKLALWLTETRVFGGAVARLGPFLAKLGFLGRIGGLLSKVLGGLLSKVLGAIGRFFGGTLGFVFTGIPFIPLIANILAGVPFGQAFAVWWTAGYGYIVLGIAGVRFFGGFILGLLGANLGPIIPAFITSALGGIAAIGSGAILIAIGAVAILTITVVIITGSAFVKEIQKLTAPEQSECFDISKSVQILDGKDRTKIKNKAGAGDILRYTVGIDQKIAGIKNITVEDKISYQASYGIPPIISKTIDVASIEAFAKQVGGTIGTDLIAIGGGGGVKKVNWQYADATTLPSQIVYELTVDKSYKSGQIDNDIIINGKAVKEVLVGRPLEEALEKAKEACPDEACRQQLDDQMVQLENEYLAAEAAYNQEVHTCTLQGFDPQGQPLCDPSQIAVPERRINPELTNVPAQCLATARLIINGGSEQAAELGNKLIAALQNCGITRVTYQNFSAIKACLQQNQIPAAAINELERSVNLRIYDNLQCVGLIYAVEAGSGGTIQNQKLNAQDHWKEINNYKQIQAIDAQNFQLGDIMIWSNQFGGHMAMITDIERSGERIVKIKTVQADGLTGEVKIESIAITSQGIDQTIYGNLLGWQRRGN